MCAVRIIFAFALYGICASSSAFGQAVIYPNISTNTTVSGADLAVGESISVTTQIIGDKKVQRDPLPITMVPILDYSGSMADAIGDLKSAAVNLLGRLDASRDRAAAVAFSTDVVVLSSITADLPSIQQAIAGHGVGGLTNILGGLQQGVNLLRQAKTPLRVGILFTDGQPEPDGVTQRSEISDLLDTIAADHLAIYTIGLGDVDKLLLDTIARRSGGVFQSTPNSAGLDKIFSSIYQDNIRTLTTKSVAVFENISPELKVKDGSFRASQIPPNIDPIKFNNQMRQKVDNFYRTGALDFPTIGELDNISFFAYSFDIAPTQCDPLGDKKVPLRNAGAIVQYFNGQANEATVVIKAPYINILKCGVYLRKTWDEGHRILNIAVMNSFARPIRNVLVADRLSDNFKVDFARIAEFNPPPSSVSNKRDLTEWSLGSIPAGNSGLIKYVIRETPQAGTGAIDIETDDYWVRWNYERDAFEVTGADSGYFDLERDLLGYAAASPTTLNLIQNHLGSQQLSSGSVMLPPAEIIAQGFDWAVVVDPSALTGLPKLSLPVNDRYTGVIYVKKIDGNFDFIIEVSGQAILPHLKTSPSFEPAP